MSVRAWLLGMLMLPLLPVATASAQHVATPAAIEQALLESRSADEANRAVVLNALDREDVRQMAGRLGVDVHTARTAIGGLSSAELQELAVPAMALVDAQAGGQTTIAISVTTLLLILIIVILLAD